MIYAYARVQPLAKCRREGNLSSPESGLQSEREREDENHERVQPLFAGHYFSSSGISRKQTGLAVATR